MPGSMLSLETALESLLADDDDDAYRFSGDKFDAQVWPFLHALCAFDDGARLLENFGTVVSRRTAPKTPYGTAWAAGIAVTRKIRARPAEKHIAHSSSGPMVRLHQDDIINLRKFECQVNRVTELEGLCQEIRTLMNEPRVRPGQRAILHDWWRAANAVVSEGKPMYADACHRLWRAWHDALEGFDIHLINTQDSLKSEVRKAADRLVKELKAAIEALPPKDILPVDLNWGRTSEIPLTEKESTILESLGRSTLTGEKLAAKAGYRYNSDFRRVLSELVKRTVLVKMPKKAGYRAARFVTDKPTDKP